MIKNDAPETAAAGDAAITPEAALAATAAAEALGGAAEAADAAPRVARRIVAKKD